MRYLSIATAAPGFGAAEWASIQWFRASIIRLSDRLTVDQPTGPHVTVNALVDTHASLVRAAKLNRSAAALWTGISVLLAALRALIGALA